jgi:GntR family transcriptional regulator
MSKIITEPVYRQLDKVLKEELVRGRYLPGARFLSEREATKKYKVSRATANKVISNLVAEGMLEFRPGIGTFVAFHGLNVSLREMESFTSQIKSMGHKPSTKVLEFQELSAKELPEQVQQALSLEQDESCFHVERLRLADGEALILENRWIKARFTPGLRREDLEGSFYGLMEGRFKIPTAAQDHSIRARNVSALEGRKLEISTGLACLEVRGLGRGPMMEALWYQKLLYRGDRYEFQNQIRTRGTDGAAQVQLRKLAVEGDV